MIISTALQREGKTWDFFLFWSGFQIKQEEQQTKKHVDKGKTLVKKLGQKIKSEDKKEVKLEEVPDPSNAGYEHQQSSADNKAKSSLFTEKEDHPVRDRALAETFMKEEIVVTKDIAVKEESIQVQ